VGVKTPIKVTGIYEMLTDSLPKAMTDFVNTTQQPIPGGYHTRSILERLRMLPHDRPFEDNCTMALPGRARPVEVTANHLWMDRLVKDAAFAHSPALRQFSVNNLIADARSGLSLYEDGRTGASESQRAASLSRRAEYVLQQQECLRVKNYLICLYSAASEASF